MQRIFAWLTNLFPLWTVLFSGWALVQPELFTWFSGPWIVWGLGVIMLGMGLTLTFDDFKAVLKLPRAGVIGVLCQFVIMPLLGWSIAKLLKLDEIDPMLAVGLILVSCCPGGTASNVVAFLARANVALSVLMTIVSTFAAILMTPFLTKYLAGALVEVDASAMCWNMVKIVLVPITIGLLANQYFPKLSLKLRPVSPLISVIAIVLIVASIIGAQRDVISEAGWRLLLAPALLHIGGFGLGYLIAKLVGLREENCRTISIEVGMQNSGLGAALANKHFPATVAPVPCAVSALYHCILGSLAAGLWRLKPPPGNKEGGPDSADPPSEQSVSA